MGKMSSLSIGIMIAFTLVILFSSALNNITNNNVEFTTYSQVNELGEVDGDDLNYTNTNNSVSNFQLIANDLSQEIATAQGEMQTEGIAGSITIAFGLLSTIAVGVLKLLIAVLFESVNFLTGISANLAVADVDNPNGIPPEWGILSQIANLGIAIVIVYLSFKLISSLMKWEI